MSRLFGTSTLAAGCVAMVLALSAPAMAGPGGHGGGGGPHGGGGGPHGGGDGGLHNGGNGPHEGGGHSHGHGNGNGGGPRPGAGSHMGHGPDRIGQKAWQGPGGQRAAARQGPRGHERTAAGHVRGRSATWAERPGHGRGNEKGHGAGRMVAAGAAAAVGGAAVAGAIHAAQGPRSGREDFARAGEPDRISFRGERPSLLGGCPPGLARKYNGCNPPGLVRQSYVPWQADWWGYRGSDYRYFDGYLLRTSGPSILGYVPLLGGALYLGEPWPEVYETAPVPVYYRDYYDLGPDYRYYDDTFYRLDPGSGRIAGVAGFLTGDEFVVGQPMPIGYDVYNVPWDYRDRYADGPDAWYRYADGYVYRIDPKTMLILAAIQLLT